MSDTTDLIREVQQALGVQVDGVAGRATWTAIHKRLFPATQMPVVESELSKQEIRSRDSILSLDPKIQNMAWLVLEGCLNAGFVAHAISGTRTYAEQDELYAQGRTKPGKIVTNAPAGFSNHNFALAFDIGIFTESGAYLEESPLYDRAGAIGKTCGWLWGGDWQRQDKPHFEWRPEKYANLTESGFLAKLRELKENGISPFA